MKKIRISTARRMGSDSDAFTLVELLVTIGIIAILAAILLPAVRMALLKAEKSKATAEIRGIETAVKGYLNEYSRFPHGSGSADISYGTATMPAPTAIDNLQLMNVLRDINSTGNLNNTNNPKRIILLDIQDSASLTNGALIDPWDQQYEVTVDTSFDNTCTGVKQVPTGTNVVGRNVAVWSRGPDGVINTSDDIKSW